jgi:hypothetical protein
MGGRGLNMNEPMYEIPKERLEEFREDSRILTESSNKVFAILNDPILLAAHRAESLEYQRLIRDCLQAIIHLEDIVYPTRSRVNLERDGYEIRSGNVGWITSVGSRRLIGFKPLPPD